MSTRKYAHVKVLEPEIVEMKKSGKTKREIAEHFGLRTEQVKELLNHVSQILRQHFGRFRLIDGRNSLAGFRNLRKLAV